jgi:alpha-tubulin suppressor-like RCC1 family protein
MGTTCGNYRSSRAVLSVAVWVLWASGCFSARYEPSADADASVGNAGAAAMPDECIYDADCKTPDACSIGHCIATHCAYTPQAPDFDGDGMPTSECGGTDCNDSSKYDYPGAAELCDGVDNDCDGVVDSPLAPEACRFDEQCIAGQCQPMDGCGASAVACGDHASCVDDGFGAHCQCGAGYSVDEDGSCVALDACAAGMIDLQNDASNCGVCEQACAVACSAAQCVTATQVSSGYDYSCALLSDQTVKCWGQTSDVILMGSPAGVSSQTPVQMFYAGPVAKISAGQYHACEITSDGALWCWGNNTWGQASPTDSSSAAVYPIQIPGTYADVIAGYRTTCALSALDLSIKCWGENVYGQRGDGTFDSSFEVTGPDPMAINHVTKLALGVWHSCALISGEVYCWGEAEYGQLGQGSFSSANLPTPTLVPGLSGVSDIAAGALHTCAIASGQVFCWGYGSQGQLGSGLADSAAAPSLVPGISDAVAVYAGNQSTCVRLGDQTIHCWGLNAGGQFGDGTYDSTYGPSSQVLDGASLVGLALGFTHACALDNASDVLCWGSGSGGTTFASDQLTPAAIQW